MRITARNMFAPLAAAIIVALVCDVARAQTAFYTPLAQELAGQPGTVIRKEPMRGAPSGAAAYRILYRSNLPLTAAIEQLNALEGTQPELQPFIEFISAPSDRSLVR